MQYHLQILTFQIFCLVQCVSLLQSNPSWALLLCWFGIMTACRCKARSVVWKWKVFGPFVQTVNLQVKLPRNTRLLFINNCMCMPQWVQTLADGRCSLAWFALYKRTKEFLLCRPPPFQTTISNLCIFHLFTVELCMLSFCLCIFTFTGIHVPVRQGSLNGL